MGELTTVTIAAGGVTVTASSDEWGRGRLGLVDLSGWYGGVSVSHEMPQRLGYGLFPGTSRDGGRHLTVVVDCDATGPEVHALNRLLSGLARGGQDATMTVSTPDGLTLTTTARLEGSPTVDQADHRLTNWIIPLVCPDPCLYGTPRTVQAQSHSGEGAGLTWPLFGPVLSYGAPTAPPIVSANNRGNAPAYATAVVRGNAPAGFDLRIGSARVVWGYELSEGMAVEVDLRGAVTVAGVSQQAGVTLADWQPIAPGATATCSVEPASGDGACWAEITIRDTYL